ncbi:MAG: FkbM family methyltransferase, partial [Saprospiraceae bacterium]
MVESQKKMFKKIVSIELGHLLFKKAKRRFINDNNVTIVSGDSGEKLKEILDDIDEPVIFWLDGHYSSGVTAKGSKKCPVYEEIDAIFNSINRNDHIILIDDARLFTGKNDYPEVNQLTAYIHRKNGKYKMDVKDDIIRYWID